MTMIGLISGSAGTRDFTFHFEEYVVHVDNYVDRVDNSIGCIDDSIGRVRIVGSSVLVPTENESIGGVVPLFVFISIVLESKSGPFLELFWCPTS